MRESGEMSTLEFLSWATLIAGLLFYADIWWKQEHQQSYQQTNAPSVEYKQTDNDKVVLCKAWEDCKILASAIVWESRGEPREGQRLVGKVILNRVEHPSWPDTIKGVVYEKGQFSYLQDKHKQRTPTQKDWTTGYVVAYNLLHGVVSVDSNATFYHNERVKPFWSKQKEMVASVGNHVFYEGGR